MSYRILEEISIFADGSRRVEFTLEVQCATNPSKWGTLGISATLADAHKLPGDTSGLPDRPQSPEENTIAALRCAYRDAADLALLLSDEVELGRLPIHDGASALRMFAGLFSLIEKLTS
jgi:hypothetical protein